MREPQYYWQVINNRGNPLEDMSDEAFEQRLEELIQALKYAEQLEATPWESKVA